MAFHDVALVAAVGLACGSAVPPMPVASPAVSGQGVPQRHGGVPVCWPFLRDRQND